MSDTTYSRIEPRTPSLQAKYRPLPTAWAGCPDIIIGVQKNYGVTSIGTKLLQTTCVVGIQNTKKLFYMQRTVSSKSSCWNIRKHTQLRC